MKSVARKRTKNNAYLTAPGEDRDLIRKAQQGDAKARDRIVEAYLGYGCKVGRTYNSGIPQDELGQEVTRAIIEAIDGFDFSYNNRFAAFLWPKIRGRMTATARDWSKHSAAFSLNATRTVDGGGEGDEGCEDSYLDHTIAADCMVDDPSAREIGARRVDDLLSVLDETEREVFLLSSLGAGDMTTDEIGARFGLCDEWARKQLHEASRKLRDAHGEPVDAAAVCWLVKDNEVYGPTIGITRLRRLRRDLTIPFLDRFRALHRRGLAALRDHPRGHHISDRKLELAMAPKFVAIPYDPDDPRIASNCWSAETLERHPGLLLEDIKVGHPKVPRLRWHEPPALKAAQKRKAGMTAEERQGRDRYNRVFNYAEQMRLWASKLGGSGKAKHASPEQLRQYRPDVRLAMSGGVSVTAEEVAAVIGSQPSLPERSRQWCGDFVKVWRGELPWSYVAEQKQKVNRSEDEPIPAHDPHTEWVSLGGGVFILRASVELARPQKVLACGPVVTETHIYWPEGCRGKGPWGGQLILRRYPAAEPTLWLEYHHELTARRAEQDDKGGPKYRCQYDWPTRPPEPAPERHWSKPRWGVAASLEATEHERLHFAKKRARVSGMSAEDLDDLCHTHGIASGARYRCGYPVKSCVYELPEIASLAAYLARDLIERVLADLSELPLGERLIELDNIRRERRRCIIWRGSERRAA
jgi:RNA polymerase sigma factor (sigma-70 family)